ncbi:MAG TPA: C1 family peptidase [Polyangia bacterium]|jgi:C1A family cysteine protease|nr:C1 family peptidase [Polyangia bacterium]
MKYGWIPDAPDHRDVTYSAPALDSDVSVDLRPTCPAIYDQGDIGSCTANAIAAAIEYDYLKARLPAFTPSRLFIYYNARELVGTIAADAGAMIRDGIKSIIQSGWCPEPLWPYEDDRLTTKPTDTCYTNATAYRTLSYQRVTPTLAQLKGCLASGYPFVFGFSVYESFEPSVANTGRVALPSHNESRLGAHAVLCVGYQDATQDFLIRNSWGAAFGTGGYCRMPYAYLLEDDLAADFWTIRVPR